MPLKGYTSPIIDLGTYKFKYLNTGKITPEEYFMNAYVYGVYIPEHIRICTKKIIYNFRC